MSIKKVTFAENDVVNPASGKRLKKPTKTHTDFWLYEEDSEIAAKTNPNPEWKGGKWMMFFDNTVAFIWNCKQTAESKQT